MAHRSGKVTNIAASVKAKLEKLAPQYGQQLDALMLLYALEGVLRRLVHSPKRDHFILKGGLLLFGRHTNLTRPTRDLDLMGQQLRINQEEVAALVRELCEQQLPEEDGLRFDAASLMTEIIIEEGDYQGVRAKLDAYLGRSRIRVVIDIAAGDPIVPGPQELTYRTLLGQEALQLKAYSLESVVAEKFDALVNRGLLTSRLKDCYDLWALAQDYPFDGTLLQQAIQATFAARGRAVTAELPVALTLTFAEDTQKQQQWAAFRSGKHAASAPARLSEVLAPVIRLLEPLWAASSAGQAFAGSWDQVAGQW